MALQTLRGMGKRWVMVITVAFAMIAMVPALCFAEQQKPGEKTIEGAIKPSADSKFLSAEKSGEILFSGVGCSYCKCFPISGGGYKCIFYPPTCQCP